MDIENQISRIIYNNKKKLRQSTNPITENDLTSTVSTTVTSSNNLNDLNYINVSGDRMEGVLIIDPYLEFSDSTQQYTGFTNTKNTLLASIDTKTTGISYSDFKTTISNVEFNSSIIMPNDSLTIDNITNLNSSLNTITNNIINNTSDIVDL